MVLYVSLWSGLASLEGSWSVQTESVFGVFWGPRPPRLCVVLQLLGGLPVALFAFALFFVVAAASLLPFHHGFAFAGLSPCFHSPVVHSVFAVCLAGQFVFGALVVIRGFFNDGMFVLKWIYQVVARELVQVGMFGLMTLNDLSTSLRKGASLTLAANLWKKDASASHICVDDGRQLRQVAVGWKGMALLVAFLRVLWYSFKVAAQVSGPLLHPFLHEHSNFLSVRFREKRLFGQLHNQRSTHFFKRTFRCQCDSWFSCSAAGGHFGPTDASMRGRRCL